MSSEYKIALHPTDASEIKNYDLHFVPCKVRYTGTTQEYKDNFEVDTENATENANENDTKYLKTYVRGRKIVGKPLSCLEHLNTVLIEETIDDEGQNTFNQVAKISKIINYEREGNESRLEEEMAKFEEYVRLNELIHT